MILSKKKSPSREYQKSARKHKKSLLRDLKSNKKLKNDSRNNSLKNKKKQKLRDEKILSDRLN
jgi:hypothetical protein